MLLFGNASGLYFSFLHTYHLKNIQSIYCLVSTKEQAFDYFSHKYNLTARNQTNLVFKGIL